MKKEKFLSLILWAVSLLWMVVIFCFSAENAEESTQTSNGFTEIAAQFICKFFSSVPYDKILGTSQFLVRKAAHFSIYTILGLLVFLAAMFSDFKKKGLISALICLFYAVSDEIHQYFVPGRSCRIFDVSIDFCGSLCGIIFVYIIFSILKKYKKFQKNT